MNRIRHKCQVVKIWAWYFKQVFGINSFKSEGCVTIKPRSGKIHNYCILWIELDINTELSKIGHDISNEFLASIFLKSEGCIPVKPRSKKLVIIN